MTSLNRHRGAWGAHGPTPPPRLALVLPSAARGAYWIPLIRELQRRTAGTTVFTADPGPLQPGTAKTAGLDIRPIGKARYVGSDDGEDYGTGLTLLSPALLPHLRRLRPDVVLTMAFSLWSVMIALGARMGWWRMALLYDGSSPSVDRRDARLRTALRRWLVRSADVSISNSDAGRRYLAEHLRAGTRAHSLPFMVSEPASLGGHGPAESLPCEDRGLLTVGVLEPRKGVHLLLDALAAWPAEAPPWRLVVVGDGPARGPLQDRARDLGISDQVQFLGLVAHEELGRHFRYADVFVFPTLADTWGVVLLEAMTFGTAVVSSTFAGSSELVQEGLSGHVVDPSDPTALVTAIVDVVSDPEVSRRMGAHAREQMNQYTPSATAERLLRVLVPATSYRQR